MARRKRCRTHRAAKIEYRGKADSVDIGCFCGKTAVMAIWYAKPLPGWSKRQWPLLLEAITKYLESLHPEAYGGWICRKWMNAE